MKQCTKCGQIVDESSMFCPNCGNQFSNIVDEVKADQTTEQTDTAFGQTKSQEKDTSKVSNSNITVSEAEHTESKEVPHREAFENSAAAGVTFDAFPATEASRYDYSQPIVQQPVATPVDTAAVQYNVPSQVQNEEKVNVGLAVLSGFVPIAGFALYFAKKKDEPKTAKVCGKTALIVTIVSFVLSLIITLVTFVGTFGILNKVVDKAGNIDSGYSYSENYQKNDKESQTSIEKESNKTSGSTAALSNASFTSSKYADMNNMQFAINGKVYTLGTTTLQNLIDDGVQFDEENTANFDNNINSNSTSENYSIKINEDCNIYVSVGNFTDSNKTIKDCPIVSMSCYSIPDAGKDLSFNFPAGVTETQLKENSGEPSDVSNYSSSDYNSNTYTYSKESSKYYSSQGYDFRFVNGTLEEVSMDYLP